MRETGRGPEDLVILDRDGVINEDSATYIKSPEEWRRLPGSLEAIALLGAAGFEIAVATNQSGIGRGLFTEATLSAINAKMRAELAAAGGRLFGIYHCPHRPDEGCSCRKPAPGLLRQIAQELGVPLTGVPVIGDKRSDLEAAEAVGARPILVLTGQGERTLRAAGAGRYETYSDLAAAATQLIGERAGR